MLIVCLGRGENRYSTTTKLYDWGGYTPLTDYGR